MILSFRTDRLGQTVQTQIRLLLDYNVDDIHEAMKTLKIMSVYDRLYQKWMIV